MMAPQKLQLSYILNAESDNPSRHSSSQPSLHTTLLPGCHGFGSGRGSAVMEAASSRLEGAKSSSVRPPSRSPPFQHGARVTISHSASQSCAPVAHTVSEQNAGGRTQQDYRTSSVHLPIPLRNTLPFPSPGASATQGSALRENTQQCNQWRSSFKWKSDLAGHTCTVHLQERHFSRHQCDARVSKRRYADVLSSFFALYIYLHVKLGLYSYVD